jgi:NitT/TauT family transport system ATP-binding protein
MLALEHFVDTPKRMVVLDTLGRRLVKATPEEQKDLWRSQLLKLRLFSLMYDVLQREHGHEVDRDFVLETIVIHMPLEDYERIFRTFIGCARFANLFAYDETSETISLQ